MEQIPSVFSSPYLAGPAASPTQVGCTSFNPSGGGTYICIDSNYIPGGGGPSTPPGGRSPPKQRPPQPPEDTGGGCEEIFDIGNNFAGVILGTILVVDMFPGPVVPG